VWGSLPAASPTARRAYLVPRELPPGPAGFVGRTAEMEELSKALDQERQRDAFLAVIHGPPGVGKSALAITFAHSVRSRFRGGQLFAQMRGEGGGTAAVNSLIQHFVQSLRDPQDPFPGDAAEFREQYRYLTDGPYLTDGSGVLFVLDDVSPDLDIAALRPANPACALVVTCRERPSWLDVSYERELKPLPEQDALDLLRTTVGPDRVNSQEKLSLDLAVQCRGEPQALRAAGTALANRPNWDIGLLLRIANAALARLATQRSRPESFDAAYTLLTVDEQEALRALGVLGARSFAPWMLATALGTNEARGSRLASRLADAGLIDRYNSGSGAPTYVVEESVRNYAYDCAVTEGEAAETERRLDRLKEGPPLEAIGSIDELLQAHGGFTPAIDAVRNAISQARERDNRAREAAACAALADLYVDLGDMISADDLARLALSKGDSHSRARASRCLARIERRRHDFQAAIGHADRGLAQAAEAKDVPERIRVLEEKAVAVAAQGAAGETEAEKISAEVLRLCRSLGETGDPLLPGAMWARGNVLFHAHRYDEASGVLTAAKERAEALDQPRYSAWIDYLHARAALAAGDRAAAERYATQGLAAFAALRNRYGTAHCRYQLGQIHLASGHLDDAARSLREALESFRNCGDSWSESEISLGLARVYRRSAQIREAVQLQWDARRGYKQLGRRGEARKAMRELAGTVLTALRPRAVAVWMKVGFRRVLRPAGGRAGHLLAAILVAAAVGFAVYASLVPSTLLSAFGWVASLLLLAAGVAVQAG